MKAPVWLVSGTVLLCALPFPPARAADARFFRIAAPVPTTITSVGADGRITWTNEPTNAVFTIQTAVVLPEETNWVDWVQVPVSNAVTVHHTFDLHPPAGMAFIPAGSFTLGDTLGDWPPEWGRNPETPSHPVYVSAVHMDRYEVTKELWDQVRAWGTTNGHQFDAPDSGQGQATNHPAHSMTWFDCVKWCNARSERDVLVPCYYTDAGLSVIYKTGQVAPYVNWNANGHRLPTEAEWEKAARGGASGRRFPWSSTDTISHTQANYYAIYDSDYDLSYPAGYHPAFAIGADPYTSPVGYFAPNGYGLCDVAGNVWEWCWDWWDWYSSGAQTDPRGPASGTYRVFRGGSWDSYALGCRTAYRFTYEPTYRYRNLGFRCVRTADP